MTLLTTALNVFLWPGNTVCERLGVSPRDDNGMLRGFINSLVYSVILVIVLWRVL